VFLFTLKFVGSPTFYPCLAGDGELTTRQRHPHLPLVVAWAMQPSLLSAVGLLTALYALRRERWEPVSVEDAQTAVGLPLSALQFCCRSLAKQRTA
jgi:hypothetical protein